MLEYLILIAGIFLLIKGADWLISGGIALGKKLKWPDFLIGMTIIAFGTSLPELIISILAIIKNSEQIILGNLIGSNISNLLLILGILSLTGSIKIAKPSINTDLFFSIIATTLILTITFFSTSISRPYGLILLSLFFLFYYKKFQKAKIDPDDLKQLNHANFFKTYFPIIIGSLALFLGGKLVVESVIIISQKLFFSEFLISATIIAIGTSLPELITSLKALMINKKSIAIGNITGSNLFNILWVLGLTSLIKPINFPTIFRLDLIFLIIASFLFFTIMFIGKKYKLTKKKGIFLLALYLMYLIMIMIRG